MANPETLRTDVTKDMMDVWEHASRETGIISWEKPRATSPKPEPAALAAACGVTVRDARDMLKEEEPAALYNKVLVVTNRCPFVSPFEPLQPATAYALKRAGGESKVVALEAACRSPGARDEDTDVPRAPPDAGAVDKVVVFLRRWPDNEICVSGLLSMWWPVLPKTVEVVHAKGTPPEEAAPPRVLITDEGGSVDAGELVFENPEQALVLSRK